MKYEPVTLKNREQAKAAYKPQPNGTSGNANTDQELDLVDVAQRLREERNKPKTVFPVDAFPDQIRTILNTYYDCYKLPIDYHALSVLAAVSVAIGNSYAARYKRGQVYPCILYATVVGFPSSGKSPGIEFGLAPIEKMERKFREEHAQKMEEWKEQCFKNRLTNNPDPEQPESRDIIIKDATMEAINTVMMKNPHGLLLYQDELKAWINNMNTYRKGSDLEAYLSIWSGKSVKISRVGKDAIWVPYPFITVIGGIQPGVLHELATGGKADNGFLARILFAYPDDMNCPPETDQEPDEMINDLYNGIISFIMKLPHKIEQEEHKTAKVERIEIPLSEAAKARYIEFLNEYSDNMNESEDEAIKGILGKLKQYCLRISLILEMLELACQRAPKDNSNPDDPFPFEGWDNWGSVPEIEEMEKLEISLKSLENSIRMTEYFRRTALKVIDRLESPVNQLPLIQKFFYEQLPEEMDSAQAKKIAAKIRDEGEDVKLSDRTVLRMLADPRLFRRRPGAKVYEKIWL